MLWRARWIRALAQAVRRPPTGSSKTMKQRIISIPPVYLLACVIFIFLLRVSLPIMNWIHFPLTLSGLLLLVAGVYFVASAHQSLARHATPVNFAPSTCIIQEGLYSRSRNPMYLGFVALLIGLAVLCGNVLALLSPLFLFCLLNWMFIPYEEEKMENTFGKDYLNYKQKVRRWF